MIVGLARKLPRPLIAYRNSTYVNEKYPRNSFFSDFMGLTEELRLFRRRLEREEKKEVRNLSALMIMIVGTLGYMGYRLTHHSTFSNTVQLKLSALKISLQSSNSSKAATAISSLQQLQTQLKANPYNYADYLPSLIELLPSVPLQQVGDTLERVFLMMLQRNKSAGKSKLWLQGAAYIVQQSLKESRKVDGRLIEALLIAGSLRQVYLASRYNQQHKVSHSHLSTLVRANLEGKKEDTHKYYDSLGKDLLSSPQLQFLISQEDKWTSFIKSWLTD